VSAFSQLLDEAGRLDVERLAFEVDPRGYTETDARERWTCRGTLRGSAVTGHGRTGEEALRRVVAFLGGVAS
jgi:hypothetical protein